MLISFKAIGLQFPHFLNKKLTLKNVEHALCEYDKYYRAATSQPTRDSHGRSLDLAYYLQRSWLHLADVFGKGTQGELSALSPSSSCLREEIAFLQEGQTEDI